MNVTVLIAGVVAACAAVVMAIRLTGVQGELTDTKAKLAATIIDSQAKLVDAAKSASDTQARLEAVIVGLKDEISKLEGDLATCSDPSAVRSRLRQLLSPDSTKPSSAGGVPNPRSPA